MSVKYLVIEGILIKTDRAVWNLLSSPTLDPPKLRLKKTRSPKGKRAKAGERLNRRPVLFLMSLGRAKLRTMFTVLLVSPGCRKEQKADVPFFRPTPPVDPIERRPVNSPLEATTSAEPSLSKSHSVGIGNLMSLVIFMHGVWLTTRRYVVGHDCRSGARRLLTARVTGKITLYYHRCV